MGYMSKMGERSSQAGPIDGELAHPLQGGGAYAGRQSEDADLATTHRSELMPGSPGRHPSRAV